MSPICRASIGLLLLFVGGCQPTAPSPLVGKWVASSGYSVTFEDGGQAIVNTGEQVQTGNFVLDAGTVTISKPESRKGDKPIIVLQLSSDFKSLTTPNRTPQLTFVRGN